MTTPNNRAECGWCGGDAIKGSTCPRSIECPRCGAFCGHPCKRPSGHRAPQLHMERVHEAERIDRENHPHGNLLDGWKARR